MTDIGNPNHELPPLNPLKARSTVAAILSLIALVGPLLGGGIGEILAEVADNADLIRAQTDTAVNALNVLVGVVAFAWFWLERRAPNFRLSFKAR